MPGVAIIATRASNVVLVIGRRWDDSVRGHGFSPDAPRPSPFAYTLSHARNQTPRIAAFNAIKRVNEVLTNIGVA